MSNHPSIDDLPSFLATAREQGWDTRPVLLRVQTDLFVNATPRTPDMVASYESMALAMIPVVDDDTAHHIACKVAGLPEVTDLIRDALLLRGGGAAAACIAAMPRIGPNWGETLARSGNIIETRGLAARADLSPVLIAHLIERDDAAIDLTLVQSTAISLPPELLGTLIERARTHVGLAKALMQRADLTFADKAAFYVQGDTSARRDLREGLERNANLSPRAGLPLLRDEEVLRLISTARARDPEIFSNELATLSGLSLDTILTIQADKSCELLALLLVALGIDPEDGAIVFISGEEDVAYSVKAVFGLVELMRTTSRGTADRIVRAACGIAGTAPMRTGRYVPATDPAVAYPNDPSRRPAATDKAAQDAVVDPMTAALRRFLGGRRSV